MRNKFDRQLQILEEQLIHMECDRECDKGVERWKY